MTNDDDAARRNELVDRNVRLLWAIINRHFAQLARIVGEDEVFQEAYLGALEAAVRFKPEMGYKFTTYMGTCVWGKLNDYIRNRRPHTRTRRQRMRIIFTDPGAKRFQTADTRPPAHTPLEDADRAEYIANRLLDLASSDRDRRIIEAYFGLTTGVPRSGRDVAKLGGVTPAVVFKLAARLG